VLFASGNGKKLYVSIHAAPNVKRYTVEKGAESKGFTKQGEAVSYFNEL